MSGRPWSCECPIRIDARDFLIFVRVGPLLGHPGLQRGSQVVQVRRIGQTLREANFDMFADYLVNPEWVFGLLQGSKMIYETVRRNIIRGAENVPRLRQNLDA